MHEHAQQAPVERSRALFPRQPASVFVLSMVVTGVMAALALAGLLFPEALHPTDDLCRASIATSAALLVIGLPILLGAMALAHCGVLLGLLFWPGMLLFVMYHAVAFAAGAPFSVQGYVYGALLALSIYTLVHVLAGVDAPDVQQRLKGRVSERITVGTLNGRLRDDFQSTLLFATITPK